MSKLSVGIVGLPNVGKSTLFNALTKKGVPAENYPFCTIDPSVGIVVEFVDIAGLVRGASEGEGLGNKFLSHIREVDAIIMMVRTFEDPDIIHVHDKVDPLFDIEIINLELEKAGINKPTLYVLNISEVAGHISGEFKSRIPGPYIEVDPVFGTGLDQLIFEARKQGLKFIIGTDTHEVQSMEDMKYGISVAKRGWCTAHDILNTRNEAEFSRWLMRSNIT